MGTSTVIEDPGGHLTGVCKVCTSKDVRFYPPSLSSSNSKQKWRSLLTRIRMTAAPAVSSRLLWGLRGLSRSETPNSAWGTLSPLITSKEQVANCPNYSRAVPHRPPRARPGGAASGRERELPPPRAQRPAGWILARWEERRRVCGLSRDHLPRLHRPGPGWTSHTTGAPAVLVEESRASLSPSPFPNFTERFRS